MPLTVANHDSVTKLSDTVLHPAPLWALVGPTAVGKSELAMALSLSLGAEIISCDSVQCYRHFDIGSAKPSAADRARVPHHLLDVADAACPDGAIDAHGWAEAAKAALMLLRRRGKQPLLCGGTGMYLRALRDGLVPVPKDAALRAEWAAREADAPGAVYAALHARDPQSASRIGPHNPARLLRALEMVLCSGQTVAALWQQQPRTPKPMQLVALDARREWLLPRMRQRTEAMVQRGLLDEVRTLLSHGVPSDAPPMRAVGYREALACVRGALPAAHLIDTIVARTWQYARRQRTWLRREPHVVWLDAEALAALPLPDRVKQLVVAFVGEARTRVDCAVP